MTQIFQVDAFTGEPFRGNPAAVCLLDAPADVLWMQSVANEKNLSDTAFLHPEPGTDNVFNLRWFTPSVEVSLCGHATLASAHILWEASIVKGDEIIFHTLSGELRVWREGSLIWMDLPCDSPERTDFPFGLLKALALSAHETEGKVKIFKGAEDYLLVLESEEEVRSISPDFKALTEIESRGFIVTAKSSSDGVDFVSRFFAPALSIDEDPVTGSAHCTLAPYWAGVLGKDELTARQLSRRGGALSIRFISPSRAGINNEARVHIGGKAITIFKGKLF